MKRPNHHERGNIFTILFGAVAVVGIVTAATMQLISGPIKTATRVNNRNMAESNMIIGVRIIVLDAATLANNGDVDSDNFIEPREYTTVATGGITGGGSIPTTIGATRTDPWGKLYGYCVWDSGPTDNGKNDAGVGATNRLNGGNNQLDTVIALVSAGPNKVFETSCLAFDGAGTDGVSTPSGSDDLVQKYTYSEAQTSSGGLWTLKTTDTTTANINKNVEIYDTNAATPTVLINKATGVGDFLGITTDIITAKTANDIDLMGYLNVSKAQAGNTLLYALDVLPTTLANNLIARFGVSGGSSGFRVRQNALSGMLYSFEDGDVGIGTASPAYRVEINDNMTGTSGTDYSLYVNSTTTPPSASSANSYGAYVYNNYTPALDNTGSVYGGLFYGGNNATAGNLNELVGGFNFGENNSTGGVGSVYGGYNYGLNDSTGGVTELTGSYNRAVNSTTGLVDFIYGSRNESTNNSSAIVDEMYGSRSSAVNSSGTVNSVFGSYSSGGGGGIIAEAGGADNFTISNTGATVTTSYGSRNRNQVLGTGAVTTVYGSYSEADNQKAVGTIPTLYGAYNYGHNSGAGTTTTLYGAYNYGQAGSTGTVTTLYGDYSLGQVTAGASTTTLYGTYSEGQNNKTSGTIPNVYGTYNKGTNSAAGTVTNLYGSYNLVENGAGTATNAYGSLIDLTNTGTVTNYYGLKIEDEGTASPNYYSIHTGTTKSYFGGLIGIGSGKTAPAYDIDSAGSIRTTSVILTSDARLKKNISTLDDALNKVIALRGVTYDWIKPANDDQKRQQIGLIAQEVEKIYPQIVMTDKDGMKAVNYPALVAPMIEAIKILYTKITTLFNVVEQLTTRIETLEERNQALEVRLQKLESSQK